MLDLPSLQYKPKNLDQECTRNPPQPSITSTKEFIFIPSPSLFPVNQHKLPQGQNMFQEDQSMCTVGPNILPKLDCFSKDELADLGILETNETPVTHTNLKKKAKTKIFLTREEEDFKYQVFLILSHGCKLKNGKLKLLQAHKALVSFIPNLRRTSREENRSICLYFKNFYPQKDIIIQGFHNLVHSHPYIFTGLH